MSVMKIIVGSVVLMLVNIGIAYFISTNMHDATPIFVSTVTVGVFVAEFLLFLMLSILTNMNFWEVAFFGDDVVRSFSYLIFGIFEGIGAMFE